MWRSPAAGAALFASVFAVVGAAPSDDAPRSFSLVPVGPGAWAAIARPGDEASIGNAGFVIGSDGVAVVDAFATPEAAAELLAAIRKITRSPVRWLINTHSHGDHVGGNAAFAKAGALLVAHENARAGLRIEELTARAKIRPEEREAFSRLLLPAVTYRDRISIWLGERRIEVFTRPGHTGGDSIVLLPDANILFAGDLVWKNTIPNLSDAKTDAWIETLDGLLKDFPRGTFVPGHGEVARPLDVRLFRDYLVGLRLAVARALRDGKSGAAVVETVVPLLRNRYGSWTWFEFAPQNVEQTEAELKGTKSFPPPASP